MASVLRLALLSVAALPGFRFKGSFRSERLSQPSQRPCDCKASVGDEPDEVNAEVPQEKAQDSTPQALKE